MSHTNQWVTLASGQAEGVNSTAIEWSGGDGHIIVTGTFGGTTVTLQFSQDNSTFVDSSVTFTAAGQNTFKFGPGYIRLKTAGGAGASINAKVHGYWTPVRQGWF